MPELEDSDVRAIERRDLVETVFHDWRGYITTWVCGLLLLVCASSLRAAESLPPSPLTEWKLEWTRSGGFAGGFPRTWFFDQNGVYRPGCRLSNRSLLAAVEAAVAQSKPERWPAKDPRRVLDGYRVRMCLQLERKNGSGGIYTTDFYERSDLPEDLLALVDAVRKLIAECPR